MIAFIYLESICQLLEATNEFISPDIIIYLHKFSILNKQHIKSESNISNIKIHVDDQSVNILRKI